MKIFTLLAVTAACLWYILTGIPTATVASGGSTLTGATTTAPASWPPKVGAPYPDITLPNYDGQLVRISQLRGKVVILEPIGMTCPACNAFAGSNTHGSLPGAQGANMPSFEEFFRRDMKDIEYDDPRLVHVSLLLYNLSMQGPRVEDAKAWAEHFKLAGRSNHYVLAGGPGMVNQHSYDMIPGFQLIDKNGVLRVDSSGHNPRDDLRTLLKMVPVLAEEPVKQAQLPKQRMAVQAAYDAIPHKRTSYAADQSTAVKEESAYLAQLFLWVDAGVVQRVQTMKDRPTEEATISAEYDVLLSGLDGLVVPPRLQSIHTLIHDAIALHKKVLVTPGGDNSAVGESSDKLKRAYMLLMQAYPAESPHNRDSFYQHLCALDFI